MHIFQLPGSTLDVCVADKTVLQAPVPEVFRQHFQVIRRAGPHRVSKLMKTKPPQLSQGSSVRPNSSSCT